MTFEELPEILYEIPLDEEDGRRSTVDNVRSSNVVTNEPYATSQLEVTTVSNEILFPEDMFER